jgi:hypothetical protein
MTEQKLLHHCPPLEFTRVNGVLIRMSEYRKLFPLTTERVEQNRRGFIKDFGLMESDFGEEAR